MRVHGVTLVGINAATGEKLLFTLALMTAAIFRFWGHQAIAVLLTVLFIVGALSIWIGPHSNFATVGGLIGAGIAFALQRFKDAMYREILGRFSEEGISVASGTYDIVGMPPLRVRLDEPKQP